MNTPRFAYYVAALTMGALLAGCSSGGSVPAPAAGALSVEDVGTLAHGLAKPSNTFQYITNSRGNDVSILDYPTSKKQVGAISGVSAAWGACANVLYGSANKTFWIVAAGTDSIDEFKVGDNTPLKVKTVTASGDYPGGCAIDPTTGDMAVTIPNNGKVVIFKGGSSIGTVYSTPLSQAYFDGYDNHGNLFVNGGNNYTAILVVLEKGSNSFQLVTQNTGAGLSGNVQWDGKYLTVGDQASQIIYRYAVHGTNLTLKSQVRLLGTRDCVGTWIGNGDLICPDTIGGAAYIFKYPAGGSPIAILKGTYDWPTSAVEVTK